MCLRTHKFRSKLWRESAKGKLKGDRFGIRKLGSMHCNRIFIYSGRGKNKLFFYSQATGKGIWPNLKVTNMLVEDHDLNTWGRLPSRRWAVLGSRTQGGSLAPQNRWAEGLVRFCYPKSVLRSVASGKSNCTRTLSLGPNMFWRFRHSLTGSPRPSHTL